MPALCKSFDSSSLFSIEIVPDQHRLTLLMALANLLDNRIELGRLCFENTVLIVAAYVGLVSRDFHDVQRVNVPKFVLLRHRGTRHAGQLCIHAEIILKRDGRVGFGLLFHLTCSFASIA